MTVAGNPARAIGLNKEGIRRRGLDEQAVQDLREAHRVVYRSGLGVAAAVAQLRELAERSAAVGLFVRSVEASKLGIVRSRSRAAV
jgi:UDP-N-acetylglucosamine acyltransferase